MTGAPPALSTRFGQLRIGYDRRLLTPRAWTVAQSEWAHEILAVAGPGDVLELCSGAGHIGLHAVRGTGRRLVCVDVEPAAGAWIRRNAEAAGVGEVEVRQGRIEDCLTAGERFALVIADPPWVPTATVEDFPEDPVGAIDGGADGLVLARQCLRVASRHLRPGGSLVLQVGTPTQVDSLVDSPAGDADGLVLQETRRFPRGALVRLDRPDR